MKKFPSLFSVLCSLGLVTAHRFTGRPEERGKNQETYQVHKVPDTTINEQTFLAMTALTDESIINEGVLEEWEDQTGKEHPTVPEPLTNDRLAETFGPDPLQEPFSDDESASICDTGGYDPSTAVGMGCMFLRFFSKEMPGTSLPGGGPGWTAGGPARTGRILSKFYGFWHRSMMNLNAKSTIANDETTEEVDEDSASSSVLQRRMFNMAQKMLPKEMMKQLKGGTVDEDELREQRGPRGERQYVASKPIRLDASLLNPSGKPVDETTGVFLHSAQEMMDSVSYSCVRLAKGTPNINF